MYKLKKFVNLGLSKLQEHFLTAALESWIGTAVTITILDSIHPGA